MLSADRGNCQSSEKDSVAESALSPLINLETQHDGRSAWIRMKKAYYFNVVVEEQKGFAREHQNGFYET